MADHPTTDHPDRPSTRPVGVMDGPRPALPPTTVHRPGDTDRTDRWSTDDADHDGWRDRPVDHNAAEMTIDEKTGRPTSHRVEDRETGKPKPVSGALKFAINAAAWTLSVIATYIAAKGQIAHAEKEGVTNHLKFLFPAALELTSIVLMLMGYARARRGNSPWPLWVPSLSFGAWAVHLQLDNAGKAGVLFATTSVAALLLWFVKLAGDYKDYLADNDQGGFGALWFTDTRLAFRASLIRAKCRKVKRTSTSIELGLTWIATYDDVNSDPETGKKLGQRIRRRHAWRQTFRAAGINLPSLPAMTTLERVRVEAAPTTDRADGPTVDDAAPTTVVDRPEPTTPTVHPQAPTTNRAEESSTDTPTARPVDRPVRHRMKPTTDRPAHLVVVHSPAAVANAAALRDRYGDTLPTSGRQIRSDMGWSADRAKAAVAAHHAEADLDEADDDRTERAS